jgi:hypothetical protein
MLLSQRRPILSLILKTCIALFPLVLLAFTGEEHSNSGSQSPTSLLWGGAQNNVLSHPPFPGDVETKDFQLLTANGTTIKIGHFLTSAYAHFSFDGPSAAVTIAVADPITVFSISPRSRDVEAVVTGNELIFVIEKPEKLIVQINDLPSLFVFAERRDNDSPLLTDPRVYSVLDFDVDSTGRTLNTAQIQHAIDHVADSKSGRGGTLVFPFGKYLTGSLEMRSNVTLYLSPGALVQGTSEKKDYPRSLGIAEHLVLFHNVTNSSIRGKGAFDASGTRLRAAEGLRHRVLLIVDSDNILVEGVTLRNSGTWNTHIVRSRDIALRNVKVLNDVSQFATDGIDIDSSSRVVVENAFVHSGDDAIVVKQTGRGGKPKNVEDVLVSGNVLWTRKSALKIGTETEGELINNVVFEDNDVVHADRGIVVYLYDGALVQNVRFNNNRFERIGGDSFEKLIHIRIRERRGVGRIRNLAIDGLYSENYSSGGSAVEGLGPAHGVHGLLFKNIVIAGKERRSAEEAGIVMNRYVEHSFSWMN